MAAAAADFLGLPKWLAAADLYSSYSGEHSYQMGHTFNFLYEMWGQICACCSHEQNPTEHVQCTGLGWWESWQLTTVSANKSYVSTNDRLLVGACHQLDNWEWHFLKSVHNNMSPRSQKSNYDTK